jgi:hypothetical protein
MQTIKESEIAYQISQGFFIQELHRIWKTEKFCKELLKYEEKIMTQAFIEIEKTVSFY